MNVRGTMHDWNQMEAVPANRRPLAAGLDRHHTGYGAAAEPKIEERS